MASKLSGIELTRYDDLFKTDAEREADRQERIQIVPAAEVFPYSRQPYTIDRPTPDLVRLMDSIEHIGIAEPLIVRPRDTGGYEIISGHRRDYCAKAVGLDTRPVLVRNYSDEEADILVVDYNINREDLLPSEKAKAYKLKLDAMKRQGQRTDLTSLQLGEKLGKKTSVKFLAEQATDNVTSIQRYVRLNKLIPPLLDAVDAGTLKFVPAAPTCPKKNRPTSCWSWSAMRYPRRWDRLSGSSSSVAKASWRITSSTSSCGRKSRWSARSRSAMTGCKNTFPPATP